MTSTPNLTRSLSVLKTVLDSSRQKDLTYLNNIIFLAQKKNIINLYDDFRIFGKIGVSSPRLGWDYNFLLDKMNKIECEDDLTKVSDFGREVSKYDSDMIGLLTYYLFLNLSIEDNELTRLKNEILD